MYKYIPFIHKIEKEKYKEQQLPLYKEIFTPDQYKKKEEYSEEKGIIIIEL